MKLPQLFYRVLATLLPTKDVTALVGFLTTFTQKLSEAEAAQKTIAEDYNREIAFLEGKRDEALETARKAGKILKVVSDLVD